jgi:RecA/RadA recombinase
MKPTKDQKTRKRINKKEVVDNIKKSITSNKKIKDEIKVISSGSDQLDLALSGGYPVSRIINIVGDSSTGKTLLATEFIAYVKKILKSKLIWFYDDVEERYSFNTMKMYGFKIIKPGQENSETIEDFEKRFKLKVASLKDNETLIYVLDSFDMIGSEAEQKRDKKKGEKGTYNLEKQKELGVFFRTRKKDIKNKNIILIIISQVRVNINATFGRKYYRTGGKAFDHMASVIMWLAEVEKHKRKGRTIGVTTKVQVTKVGNDRPFRECFIDILFDYGVDNITSNICFLYDLRTADRGKLKEKVNTTKCIEWDGNEYSLKGLTQYIEKNNLEDKLKQRCTDKWEEIEESIKTKRKPKY